MAIDREGEVIDDRGSLGLCIAGACADKVAWLVVERLAPRRAWELSVWWWLVLLRIGNQWCVCDLSLVEYEIRDGLCLGDDGCQGRSCGLERRLACGYGGVYGDMYDLWVRRVVVNS